MCKVVLAFPFSYVILFFSAHEIHFREIARIKSNLVQCSDYTSELGWNSKTITKKRLQGQFIVDFCQFPCHQKSLKIFVMTD